MKINKKQLIHIIGIGGIVPESQIVIRFWIVAVILALVGLATFIE